MGWSGILAWRSISAAVLLCCACLAKPPASSSSSSTSTGPYQVPSGPKAFCDPCDIRKCPQITPETCEGTLMKDTCGCCPRCDRTQRPQLSTVTSNRTCADLACSGSQMCVLNIQGIPICRCPSIYWCRRQERQERREVCGRDGKTYKSKCYLKVSECTQNRKIRVAHKGACKTETERRRPLKRIGREPLGPRQNRDPSKKKNRRRKQRRLKAERAQGDFPHGNGNHGNRNHGDRHRDRGRERTKRRFRSGNL